MQVVRETILTFQNLFEEPDLHEPERMLLLVKITGLFLGFVPTYFGLRDCIGTLPSFTLATVAATTLSRKLVNYFTLTLIEP